MTSRGTLSKTTGSNAAGAIKGVIRFCICVAKCPLCVDERAGVR